MPLLAKWIAAALGGAVGGFIFRALAALGIGYVTHTFIMPDFVAMIEGQLANVPPEVLQVLGLARVDIAVTIILSAVSVRLASRMVWRRT